MTSSTPIENVPVQEPEPEVQNSKEKGKKEQPKITIEKKIESAESIPMTFGASSFDEECASPRDLVNPVCTVCNKVFSKRKLRLQYNCGMCQRAVCSACAPSTVQLEGCTGLQKVCTPCIANAAKVPASQSRLIRLGEQLDALAGRPSSVAAKCTNLEEALDLSESAIAPLKNLQDSLALEKANSEKLKKALQETEKRVRAQLEQELKSSEKQPDNQEACGSTRSSKEKPSRAFTKARGSGWTQIGEDSSGMPRGMNCVNSCAVM